MIGDIYLEANLTRGFMRKKGVVNRAIVTPDKHFPLADEASIRVVCKAIELVKPDTYIDLGDTGEWELFSKHYWKDREKPPLEMLIPMLDREVQLVNDGMDIIDKSLDKVKCKKRHFIQGNHEQWLDNFVVRHPYLPQYETRKALKIKERGYKYLPYIEDKPLKIGKLNFMHGKYTPIHHAKKHLEDMSAQANKWLRGNPNNWNHGFAIVDWFSNGDFKVEVVEITDGRTSVWGKFIDGKK
jgi:hypothetical protein